MRVERQIAAAEPADRELRNDSPNRRLELQALYDQRNAINADLMRAQLTWAGGHAIEPVVRPLGWDWRIGVGVLASFPAREVIIATLGTIYSLGGDVDEESAGLQDALQQSPLARRPRRCTMCRWPCR